MALGVIIAFVIATVQLLHNLYRYIFRQKICAPLIVLFYLFTLFSFIFRIAELAAVVVDTKFFPLERVAVVCAAFATSFMVFVGLTLILSMHQLSVTVEAITMDIQDSQAQTKNSIMRVIVISWGAAYTLCQGFAVIYGQTQHEDLLFTAILYVVLMLLMCSVYSVVIYRLNK